MVQSQNPSNNCKRIDDRGHREKRNMVLNLINKNVTFFAAALKASL